MIAGTGPELQPFLPFIGILYCYLLPYFTLPYFTLYSKLLASLIYPS